MKSSTRHKIIIPRNAFRANFVFLSICFCSSFELQESLYWTMGPLGMKNTKLRPLNLIGLALICSLLLGACEGAKMEYEYPRKGQGGVPTYEKETPGIFGQGGLTIFENDGGSNTNNGGSSAGIGVNSFLWRASLDTLAFMPLLSADPFGGVIITDWYGLPSSKRERYKINLFILGTALRSDGIRAKVFKQRKKVSGDWYDIETAEKLDRDLEDAILTRARQLRIASTQMIK